MFKLVRPLDSVHFPLPVSPIFYENLECGWTSDVLNPMRACGLAMHRYD